MPAHSWLPGAMVAPTPVSALLHAVAVVKVGVFCLYRVYADIFGFEVLRSLDGEDWLIGIACAHHSDLFPCRPVSGQLEAARLAFSTIGQLGLPWGYPGHAQRSSGFGPSYRDACLWEDYFVLLAQEPFSWPRAKNTP